MSSLAASRADNFYYPPNFNPKKHGNINKLNNSHPLGKRAKNIHHGIITIRFEMPYKTICTKCNSIIDKGVRFDAEKKHMGNYFSTKIYQFVFKCYTCRNELCIVTDPKNSKYICKFGLRQQINQYDHNKINLHHQSSQVLEYDHNTEKESLDFVPILPDNIIANIEKKKISENNSIECSIPTRVKGCALDLNFTNSEENHESSSFFNALGGDKINSKESYNVIDDEEWNVKKEKRRLINLYNMQYDRAFGFYDYNLLLRSKFRAHKKQTILEDIERKKPKNFALPDVKQSEDDRINETVEIKATKFLTDKFSVNSKLRRADLYSSSMFPSKKKTGKIKSTKNSNEGKRILALKYAKSRIATRMEERYSKL